MRPDIEKIRQREQAATKGQWMECFENPAIVMCDLQIGMEHEPVWVCDCSLLDVQRTNEGGDASTEERANVDFIVHAHSDIPALLDYVAELEAELASYKRAADYSEPERTDRYLNQPIAEDARPVGKEGSKSDE